MRRKIENNAGQPNESNNRLWAEREKLSLHFRELKGTMAHFRALEDRKLAEISVASEGSIDSMNEKLKLTERILECVEMTRKLETEREQIAKTIRT